MNGSSIQGAKKWKLSKKVYLNVSCGLVLVSENTGGLNNVVSTSLTPWDLLRVPTS